MNFDIEIKCLANISDICSILEKVQYYEIYCWRVLDVVRCFHSPSVLPNKDTGFLGILLQGEKVLTQVGIFHRT